ncbi:MAG: hypothetical protein ACFFG0_42175 [Candidatus Thorarchaeota archaeon]
MDEKVFVNTVQDMSDNIESVLLPVKEHLTPERVMESGLKTVDDSVWSQYIESINPNMYLGTVYSKLSSMKNSVTDRRYVKYDEAVMEDGYVHLQREQDGSPIMFNKVIDQSGRTIYEPDDYGKYVQIEQSLNPRRILDLLVRFMELNKNRTRNPIYILKHKQTDLVYGFVSKNFVQVRDYDIYKMVKAYFEDSGLKVTWNYDHWTFNMRIAAIIDDFSVDIGGGNSMKLRLLLGNSMTGRGSAYVTIGSFEQWCSNGAMGWVSKLAQYFKAEIDENGTRIDKPDDVIFAENIRQRHSFTTPDKILQNMMTGIETQIKNGDKYLYLIDNAKEITDPIIQENKDMVEELQKDRFKLRKQEAQNVFAILKTKANQYKDNSGFSIGRAIAEVGRDTDNHERKIELEKLASKVMFSQLDKKTVQKYNEIKTIA